MRALRTSIFDRTALFSLLLVFLAACGGSSPSTPPADDDDDPVDVPVSIPPRGGASTIDVATWNVEWFGDAGNGPTDDDFQRNRVRDVILGAELDIWALQEIVDGTDFDALLADLPGWDGLLADDPFVSGGAASYSDFGGNEQKVGLLWRSDEVAVVSAEVILTENDYEFAGRPPLELHATVEVDGTVRDVVLIVLHAKASTDAESWQRRSDAAVALKAHLDTEHAEDAVWVLGDFNDDVDVSIRDGSPSPYQDFLDDPEGWSFVTEALTLAGASSTVGFDDVIDHILVSDEVEALYIDASAEVFRLDAYIDGYGSNTSDHYPVLARFGAGF